MKEVTVVYICYVPYGTDHLFRFIESYKQHHAGYDHELCIVFKGMENHALDPFLWILAQSKVKYYPLHYAGPGLDISTYQYAARMRKTKYMMFMNSSCQILAHFWLRKYMKHMCDNVGVLCTTVNIESHYNSVYLHHKLWPEPARGFRHNFTKYKLFLKNFFYWQLLFPDYPNFHFRTNAFLMDRMLFLSLKTGDINTKFKAYLVESGRNSFTRQLIKRDLRIVLVNNKGQAFGPPVSHIPNVYFKGEQEDLMIADNQTRLYDSATKKQRIEMSFKRWGLYGKQTIKQLKKLNKSL